MSYTGNKKKKDKETDIMVLQRDVPGFLILNFHYMKSTARALDYHW